MARVAAAPSSGPITALRGVGAALAEKLQRLGVTQVQDLLFVLPLRYEDRTRVWPIGSLIPGMRAAVEGEVQLTEVTLPPPPAAAMPDFRRLRLPHAAVLLFLGRAAERPRARHAHPLFRRGSARAARARDRASGIPARQRGRPSGSLEETLTPIYPLHRRRSPGAAARARQRGSARARRRGACVTGFRRRCVAPLGLPPLKEALDYMHRPPREAELDVLAAGRHPAQRRLAFEELLAHHLSLKLIKRATQARIRLLPLQDAAGSREARFVAVAAVRADRRARRARCGMSMPICCEPLPMVRLMQGDVGCGKTVVAAAAAARAAGSGLQAALMAPTELLAEQHWRNFRDWFQPLGLPVALLSGSQPARTRRSALEAIASGEVRMVVGTHALFQEGIDFAQPRAGHRRRAASLRRAAAPASAGEGAQARALPASAHHDGDADSANAGDDGLRRPGHLGHRRAAAWPHAGQDRRRAGAAARRGRRAHRRRPAGQGGRPTGCAR